MHQVCCMGSEAKDPKKNLPRAVVGVLAIVTVLYVLASLALVGMQNYLGMPLLHLDTYSSHILTVLLLSYYLMHFATLLFSP
jgi:amino acid transporter